MGGTRRQNKKSSFSFFSIFKGRAVAATVSTVRQKAKNYINEPVWEEPPQTRVRRVYPSDYDRGYWVAEQGIDRKASAFIARFHEARLSESQTMAVYNQNA